ncbi:Carbon-nitrogen hydrolase [Arthrobotrys musiformis]|uniref:Carbon-nitrogen hydrolase n=1 Tax=Arthrobotrys musiformis TaxID=47236 RepID=A0AAV9VSK4_9PEZI
MKIACLQFDTQIGKVQDNIHKADETLGSALGTDDVENKVDVLVLPELAFTGYVFKSKASIRPYLEHTTSGISTQWAKQTSRRLRCYTVVGYPELANEYKPPSRHPRASDPFSETPIDVSDDDEDDKIQDHCYNACVVTSPDGEVVTNYRKTFLYSTDEIWASEGSNFGTTTFTFPTNNPSDASGGDAAAATAVAPTSQNQKNITVALGICMDLNPYKFEALFTAYEFANHVLSSSAQLVIVPMAWETREAYSPEALKAHEKAMHRSTVGYWAMRLEPLFGSGEEPDSEDEEELIGTSEKPEDADREEWEVVSNKERGNVVVVTCNRMGRENGTLFVGSSAIMNIKKKTADSGGSLKRCQAMGMGEEGLMIVEVDI